MDIESIGERVALLRVAGNMTQMDLADRSGISINTISNIERGDGCHVATLATLAVALRVKVSVLLGER